MYQFTNSASLLLSTHSDSDRTDDQAAPFVSHCATSELPSSSPLPPFTSAAYTLPPPPISPPAIFNYCNKKAFLMCSCTLAGLPPDCQIFPTYRPLLRFIPSCPPTLLINLLCVTSTISISWSAAHLSTIFSSPSNL